MAAKMATLNAVSQDIDLAIRPYSTVPVNFTLILNLIPPVFNL